MSNDRATAMTDALDVAQKIATVCRRREIAIPDEFEVKVSAFANAEAEVNVIWHPLGIGNPSVDHRHVANVFAIPRLLETGFGQSTWLEGEDTVDGVAVTYTIYTR